MRAAGPQPGTFPAQCAPLDLNLGPSQLSAHECLPDRMPQDLPDNMPKDMPDRMPEDMPGRMPEDMPDRMPDRKPGDMSDRMPEDLPVTKWINVMLGILRSKVISERKQVYGVIFGSSSGMFVSGQRGGRDRERERRGGLQADAHSSFSVVSLNIHFFVSSAPFPNCHFSDRENTRF